MDSFDSCITILEKCLSDTHLEKSWVDEIVLFGGSTRIPKVQQMLRELFDEKDLCKTVNPDEVVAYGAAVLAAKLSDKGDKSFQDLLLRNVTPLSLGVQVKGGAFEVMIPRNTPFPTKKSKIFDTSKDNQYSALIKVYQGERLKCVDNHFLGEFRITGIPPAPKGSAQIKECFEIDDNGILTVTAEIISTGMKKELVISNENGRISEKEIKDMIKEAEKYKLEDQEFNKRLNAYNELKECIYNMKIKIKECNVNKRVDSGRLM
ncbi:heat shock 70 kDa protein 4-like [Rutidosis leptorrhynchoides]|uniref:heat shock 70 kDa protein 4-like n=1 Tax=Rutidosis leptorrhynchoides TaxID=125765 RepID=UPI003A9A33D4